MRTPLPLIALLSTACVSPVFQEDVDRAFAGPFERLEARTEGGTLTVVGAPVEAAVVSHSARFSDYRPLLEAWTEDGVLNLDIRCAPPEPLPCDPHLEVTLPEDTEVVFRSLQGALLVEDLAASVDASTTTGAVHVRRVHGAVSIATDGGGAEIEALTGALFAATRDGDVVIDGLAGEGVIETAAGRVVATGWVGTAAIDSGSGSVAVAFDAPPVDVFVQTRSGAVTLAVPAAPYAMDLQSDFGEVTTDRVEAAEPGAGVITVRSGSGDVAVHGY